MVQAMSPDLPIPRGNPLTEGMNLTTRDGVRWTAYIDGYSPRRPRRLLAQTVLPGRRLRFDSASESRLSPELPAGSPFLNERRLLALLARSPLLSEQEPSPPSPASCGGSAGRQGSRLAVRGAFAAVAPSWTRRA